MFIVKCPHCEMNIQIEQINCAIFRHGVFKDTMEQIPPHSTKEYCESVLPYIFGCGKPFKIINNDGNIEVIQCDYI
jgi:hypothetical protein